MDAAEQMGAVTRAQLLIELGRLDEADRHLRAVLASDPQDTAALGLLAAVALERGQPRDAHAIISVALGIDPADAWSLRLLARAEAALHRYRSALHAAEDAIRCEPGDANNYLLRAFLRRLSGQPLPALADALRARELAPFSADPVTELAWCMAGLSEQRSAKALMAKAVELAPTDGASRRAWAAMALEGGDVVGASRILAPAMLLEPGSAVGYAYFERTMRRVFRRGLAIALLVKGLLAYTVLYTAEGGLSGAGAAGWLITTAAIAAGGGRNVVGSWRTWPTVSRRAALRRYRNGRGLRLDLGGALGIPVLLTAAILIRQAQLLGIFAFLVTIVYLSALSGVTTWSTSTPTDISGPLAAILGVTGAATGVLGLTLTTIDLRAEPLFVCSCFAGFQLGGAYVLRRGARRNLVHVAARHDPLLGTLQPHAVDSYALTQAKQASRRPSTTRTPHHNRDRPKARNTSQV